MRGTLSLILALSVAFMAVPAVAHVQERGTVADEQLIARCIHRSARGKPWLEKTLWGLRDQEGGWIGAEVRNDNGSHDLGPMQINSWWVPRIARLVDRPPDQVRRWLQLDACFNVEAARWLLLTGLAASSDYWQAVGAYHSPKAILRYRYASSVSRHLAHRFTVSPFSGYGSRLADFGAIYLLGFDVLYRPLKRCCPRVIKAPQPRRHLRQDQGPKV